MLVRAMSAAVAFAACGFTGNAMATATFTGQLSGFEFFAIDLTPDDGLAAGYEFVSPPPGYNRGHAEVSTASTVANAGRPFVERRFHAYDLFAPLDAEASFRDATASAAVGTGLLQVGGSTAPGMSIVANAGTSSYYRYGDLVDWHNYSSLWIAPYTGFSVTADAALHVAHDSLCHSPSQSGAPATGCEASSMRAYLLLRAGESTFLQPDQYDLDQLDVSLRAGGGDEGFRSSEQNGQLQVSFRNESAEPLQLYFLAGIDGYANGVSAPIPEPQTYVLLLAGLAGVAAAVRRRRLG